MSTRRKVSPHTNLAPSPIADGPTDSPLVFISHDSRDADLAEAFANLLSDASGGVLKSFRSSDHAAPEGRRQILAIHIPGDFVDLHSYPLKRLEHSVAALTDVKVAMFPHTAVRALTAQSPTLTELLWRSTLIDAAINREWIVSVGARSAVVRLAHLFCEMYVRLERIGMAPDRTFALPLTQVDLADATGLTAVHANRMLRQLREQGLVAFRHGEVEILDWDGLRAFADFDPAYLFFD